VRKYNKFEFEFKANQFKVISGVIKPFSSFNDLNQEGYLAYLSFRLLTLILFIVFVLSP
jgi:hypothetical protein